MASAEQAHRIFVQILESQNKDGFVAESLKIYFIVVNIKMKFSHDKNMFV